VLIQLINHPGVELVHNGRVLLRGEHVDHPCECVPVELHNEAILHKMKKGCTR
jgi:hypothetical protein